jgi:hypothetical protein
MGENIHLYLQITYRDESVKNSAYRMGSVLCGRSPAKPEKRPHDRPLAHFLLLYLLHFHLARIATAATVARRRIRVGALVAHFTRITVCRGSDRNPFVQPSTHELNRGLRT